MGVRLSGGSAEGDDMSTLTEMREALEQTTQDAARFRFLASNADNYTRTNIVLDFMLRVVHERLLCEEENVPEQFDSLAAWRREVDALMASKELISSEG